MLAEPKAKYGMIQDAGIGLRSGHLHTLLKTLPDIHWLEVLADNWLGAGIMPHLLDKVADHYPVCLHSIGMDLGGLNPLNMDYFRQLKQLAKRTNAQWISDHCCFSKGASYNSHNLLPLPYTYESARHISQRIREVQDFFGQQILLENISAYLEADNADMEEGAFISFVAEEADCLLLLDVNNFFVNDYNLGRDAWQQINKIPKSRIAEIHLGGFENKGDYLLDGHNNPVDEAVWQLYQKTLEHLGSAVPTLIEWDHDLPDLQVLLDHRDRAQNYLDHCHE